MVGNRHHSLSRRGHHFSNLNSPVTGDGDGGRPRDMRGLARGVALGRRELRVPRLEHNVAERGTLLLLALLEGNSRDGETTQRVRPAQVKSTKLRTRSPLGANGISTRSSANGVSSRSCSASRLCAGRVAELKRIQNLKWDTSSQTSTHLSFSLSSAVTVILLRPLC